MAEGGGLLNRYTVEKPYRGFESLSLRHYNPPSSPFARPKRRSISEIRGANFLQSRAPQQAAGAAMALCIAVIPYVFSRSIEKLLEPKAREVIVVQAQQPIQPNTKRDDLPIVKR